MSNSLSSPRKLKAELAPPPGALKIKACRCEGDPATLPPEDGLERRCVMCGKARDR